MNRIFTRTAYQKGDSTQYAIDGGTGQWFTRHRYWRGEKRVWSSWGAFYPTNHPVTKDFVSVSGRYFLPDRRYLSGKWLQEKAS